MAYGPSKIFARVVRMQVSVLPLDSVRADGWFERIGETITSFQALCDIIGPRFFAFAMIAGARITSLTVDRRIPDNTLIEFSMGEENLASQTVETTTLAEFRKRLVLALVQEESDFPAPGSASDAEGLQRHIGPRYLLLAPLFGYSLRTLKVGAAGSELELMTGEIEEVYPLSAFRARLRTHVRQELERAQRNQSQGTIDLAKVADADEAARAQDFGRVIELLGGWPSPLAIFLRSPEGQALSPDARATVARGLGLLGSACAEFGDYDKAEEILRLGVQYAAESKGAGDVYLRLGLVLLAHGRPGEAIGPLRRAAATDGDPELVWPALGDAFLERGRVLAALASATAGLQAGVPGVVLRDLFERAVERGGEGFRALAGQLQPSPERGGLESGRTTVPVPDCAD